MTIFTMQRVVISRGVDHQPVVCGLQVPRIFSEDDGFAGW